MRDAPFVNRMISPRPGRMTADLLERKFGRAAGPSLLTYPYRSSEYGNFEYVYLAARCARMVTRQRTIQDEMLAAAAQGRIVPPSPTTKEQAFMRQRHRLLGADEDKWLSMAGAM